MNELKTLIDLCPGTRLPQYEPEIFSDKELTEYYMRKLCGQYTWYYHRDTISEMAYRYAKYVMKSRWPEAEHIIATDSGWAHNYAKFVMKPRWLVAESTIASDRVFNEWHNGDFGTKI